METKNFERYPNMNKFFPVHFSPSTKEKELLHVKYSEPDISQYWRNTLWGNLATTIEYIEDLSDLKERVNKLYLTLETVKKEVISCRESINELCDGVAYRTIVKNTTLLDLGDNLTLLHAIPIIIEETKDEVIASFPEVELFSIGSGEAEAIYKLKKAIAELYLELVDTPDKQLGRVPLSWKRILIKIIKRNG